LRVLVKWSSGQARKSVDKGPPVKERLLLFLDRRKASFIADDPNPQYSRLDHLDGLKDHQRPKHTDFPSPSPDSCESWAEGRPVKGGIPKGRERVSALEG